MNWKGCGRKRTWPNLRYYPRMCLEGLRKTTKHLSQDSRSPGRDLNPGPPEYEAGVLTTRSRHSVCGLVDIDFTLMMEAESSSETSASSYLPDYTVPSSVCSHFVSSKNCVWAGDFSGSDPDFLLVRISERLPAMMTATFSGFPQSLHANPRIAHWDRLHPPCFLTIALPAHSKLHKTCRWNNVVK
jgi:hypothetical protein